MARPYRGGRRRRPGTPRRRGGRRPPNRYRGGPGPPARQGFTWGPFGDYYRWLLPELRGREKREFFNGITIWLVLGMALFGAGIGADCLGPPGALLGLGGGAVAGAWICRRERFWRP